MKTIIFDWKRTLFNPDSSIPMDDAKNLLEAIKKLEHKMILIGKEKEGEDMNGALDNAGFRDYFDEVHFVPKKTKDMFMAYDGGDVIAVGDRQLSELEIANQCGYTTVWFRNGKFKDEESKDYTPTHIVDNLMQVVSVI